MNNKKARPEKYVLENLTINELIKDNFLEKLRGIDNNIFPVSLVFVNERGDEKNKQVSLLIISHQSNEEVKKRVLHIESQNTDLAKSVTEILEKN